MNALNDNNDPFEDIFRDRFADFESEPNEILWNKIEPQLPANPAKRFPYWQISAVILGLFLGGIYFAQKEEVPTVMEEQKNGKTINNFEKSPSELITTPNIIASASEHIKRKESELKTASISTASDLSTPPMMYKTTNTAKKNTQTVDNQKDTYFQKFTSTKTNIVQATKEQLPFVVLNNISEESLNLNNALQSNLNITAKSIFEPNNKKSNDLNISSNIFDVKSVSTDNKVVIEKKDLSILNTKSYELLSNHFKTIQPKFIAVPKEEPYFKEKKPLEFYLSAMPLLNYYTITPNGNDANFVHNIAVNDDGDRVGFYTQAGLVFTLSERLKLRTGLTFTKTNHSISYRVRTDSLVVQPADNNGVDISFADLNKIYSQSANYLGTKIEVQYTFLQGESLSHYLSVGGEASYRLNGNHELNSFANFAYGITRQIGDNAYIFIEPTFSYSLNQQSDNNSLLLVKPNKIGFNIGVNFKIK